ncbi:V-type ATP synthase subunit F [bacterium]|nr:V-type ATP synthase subunit F [bacterium]
MRFHVIGDEDTVLGFRLVGVEGEVAETPEEILFALKKAFQTDDVGIIIITERLAERVRADVEKYLYKTTFPLIIEIPDAQGPLEGRGTVRDMIRAAVGVHL